MQILPTASIGKYFNKLRPSKASPSLDGLPASERQAALEKLGSNDFPSPPQKRSKKKIFFMAFTSFIIIALAVLASVALAIDVTTNPDLVAKLKMAATNLDRMNLLPSNSDWLFDFTKQSKYTFSPGGVVNANAATFPATTGQGMTMAMLNLGPCSMLPPHYHPRATNYVVAISGTTNTYMIAENGAPMISETLTPGKMTIFPQASVHTMVNVGCDNAQLVSALSSDDAGTQNLANSFFQLPAGITEVILGNGFNLTATEAVIPPVGTGSNAGNEACLAKCHAQGKMVKRSW